MVNIRNFHSNLLKKDKKPHKDIDICYIGYITTKKFSDCENIHSVNPLYLIIHSATGYLIIYSTSKYEKVSSGILKHFRMVEKNCFMKKTMLELVWS